MSEAIVLWRRRLSELGRGVGKPHGPLFAPLLYGAGAQIEALPANEVTADPTRLRKALLELCRVLGTSALYVSAPTCMEAEAFGAAIDRTIWPPKIIAPAEEGTLAITEFDDVWSASAHLAASLEVAARLAAEGGDDALPLAALTGPATLLAETFGSAGISAEEGYDFAGRALSALARRYAQSAVAGFVVCERVLPADTAAWKAALNTLANVAKFHRVPVLLSFGAAAAPEWPVSMVPCPRTAPGGAKPYGLTVPADPAAWDPAGLAGARMLVSGEEVRTDFPVDALADACAAMLELERAQP
jgi:acetophenone carboxylase